MALDGIDFIKEIEKKLPVDEWEVNGILIWPFIRIKLYRNLQKNKKQLLSNLNKKHSIWKIVQGVIKTLYYSILDWKKILKNKKCDCIVLMKSSDRSTQLKGQYYAPIADTIREKLKKKGFSCKILEYSLNYNYRIPRFSPSKYIQPYLEFSKLKAKIRLFFSKEHDLKLRQFKKFQNILKNNHINCNLFSKKELIYQSLVIKSNCIFFQNILDKTQPKLILEICFYNPECMALSLAGKNQSIPRIDIQHGIQGNHHIAYSEWTRIPSRGYGLIPNYFWVYSENEKKVLKNWIDPNKIIIGGNVWIDAWLNQSFSFIKQYNQQFKEKFGNLDEKIVILISLQPNKEIDVFKEIIIKSSPKMYFFVRLHPRMIGKYNQIENEFQRLEKSNWEIKESTIFPLPLLLKNSNFHLTLYSSTVLEAAEFCVPSICISKKAKKLYQGLIKKRKVFFKTEIEEILNKIEQNNDQNVIFRKSQKKTEIDSLLKLFLNIS